MRAWISLAVLLIVVGALGAWVYYKPAHEVDETYALSALKAGDVNRTRLERVSATRSTQAQGEGEPAAAPAANELITLEKHAGAWRMTAPIAARADSFQVVRLLSILDARSTVRYPGADLARFGLDRPQSTLTIEDQSFLYGAINSMTREQYVMTGGTVYLVPLAYIATLPRSADVLLSRSLFGPTENPARFDLPDFTISLEDGTWAVAPAMPDVSADDRNAWVDAWRLASAMGVRRYSGNDPSDEIKVQLKDGRTLSLGVAQREPELVLVRKDEGIEYRFVAEVGRRLFAPPGTPIRN